jgi:predicted nuclease of predicted toxin-antitoxin system
MKFLVDQPVSPLLAAWLRERGHDAVHVRDIGLAAAPDTQLVALAISHGRVLITADLDYPRIIALSKNDRPGLILFRAGNVSDTQMLHLLQRTLTEVPEDQLASSIVVVGEHSIRIARLPLGG